MTANTYKKNTFKKKPAHVKGTAKPKRSFSWAVLKDKRWGLSFGIFL